MCGDFLMAAENAANWRNYHPCSCLQETELSPEQRAFRTCPALHCHRAKWSVPSSLLRSIQSEYSGAPGVLVAPDSELRSNIEEIIESSDNIYRFPKKPNKHDASKQ
jgi:hypothetical protein